MLRSLLLLLFVPITTVLADGASIVAALSLIGNDTVALNNTVASWNGDLLGTLPIIIESSTLLSDIKKGTQVAQASSNLTTTEALSVASATIALASEVESSLDTIVAAKEKFAILLLGPVILLNLKEQKSATDDLSAAIVAKVPTSLQSTALALIEPIDDAFSAAIEEYEGVL